MSRKPLFFLACATLLCQPALASRPATTQPAAKPRIAVVDFKVIGDVGIKDAGPAAAELLLASFGKDRYQPVERSQLAAILKEVDLTIAEIVENPDLLKGKKIAGVRYLVMGSVVKFGDLTVTARVVDVVNGEWGEWGKESAADAEGLRKALGALAANLEGGKVIAAAAAPEKELVLDLGGKVSMKLVLIPAGKFLMGSPAGEKDREEKEGPQHEVTISKPFHMGVCEVTKGQFAQFVADSGYKTEAEKAGKARGWDGTKYAEMAGYSWRKTGFEQASDHPVVNVTRNDAFAFCDWASKKTGKKVSLPTEAQWEYACRAGTKTTYPWGNDPDDGKGWANTVDQTAKKTTGGPWDYFSWDDGYAFTSPVGKFKANAFGLYDMIGNVCEWCADWYHADTYAAANQTDPTGPLSGWLCELRGGSYEDVPRFCRSATRREYSETYRDSSIGFRVAVEAK